MQLSPKVFEWMWAEALSIEARPMVGTASRPDLVVTDGLPAYKRAVPRELFDWKALFKNPHFRYRGLSCKVSNNILERNPNAMW